jgi:hypothetical protein
VFRFAEAKAAETTDDSQPVCGVGDDSPDNPLGGCIGGEPITVYVPTFVNASMKVWMVFGDRFYETDKACQASLSNPSKQTCIPLIGALPAGNGPFH